MSDAPKPDPKVDELEDKLDRTLKLSAAEVQRRKERDYAGELLALGIPKMEAPEPGTIILDVGITGTGKSTWAKAMLAAWFSLRVVAWDHLDEMSIYGRERPEVMLGPLTKRVTIDELRANPAMLDEPELRLAVVPTRRGPKGRGQDFCDFVDLLALEDEERDTEAVEAMGTLPYLLVIEEVARLSDYASEEFKTIATVGRHSGASVLAIAQWAAAIPHPMRRQCRRIVAHAQTWDLDIDALAQPMGAELAEQVKNLPNHQQVIWDRDAAHRGGTTAA